MFEETIATSDKIIPVPIHKNFKDIRKDRQDNNNKIVYQALKDNNKKLLNSNINLLEYERTLELLEISEEVFIEKCRVDDLFCKLSASKIAKKSSRQGSKDEMEQINTCNLTAQKCGLIVSNLSATELRPTKDGSIISKKEMKQKNIQKDCCLKSFDGKISGKVNGYISAKVAYGAGGHQDNVFEEMDTIAEWWKKYKSGTEEILVILIDTDLKTKFDRLNDKYLSFDNIFVFNHIDFQQYMIHNYYKDESM